jgi:hypothetical protein
VTAAGDATLALDVLALLSAHAAGDEPGIDALLATTPDERALFAATVGALVEVIGADRLADVLAAWRRRLAEP